MSVSNFVRLGDLCELDKQQGQHVGLPYLGLEHIEGGAGKFSLSPDNLDAKSSTFRFSNKHILYGRLRPYLKKVALPDVDGRCSTEIFPILPKDGVDRRYLAYWFLSDTTTESINATCTGARMPRAAMEEVLEFKLFSPPFAEQQHIVALLDEAFEGIATAKVNAEKNIQNARALFEAALAGAFEQGGGDWFAARLGEVCDIARGGSPRPIKAFLTDAPDGVSWIKISDASASSKYIYQTKQKIKPSGVTRSRLVHSGDFLLSNSMSFGRPYIMRTSGCIHDGWLVLSRYEETFHQDFLYLLLGSQFVYRQFDRLAAGSTVRNLNIDLASSVTIPVPPLTVQRRIAADLNELSGWVERLESLWQRKLVALDALKQSLLQQTFSGQL